MVRCEHARACAWSISALDEVAFHCCEAAAILTQAPVNWRGIRGVKNARKSIRKSVRSRPFREKQSHRLVHDSESACMTWKVHA
eukprot:2161653-Pleurochrysis_carterae.AAC.3